MKKKISVIFVSLYLLIAGFVFANELYMRLYDRGNSEMAGLGTYLLTMPSSWLIDSLSKILFGVEGGSSDAAFIFILAFAVILNAGIIFLILSILNYILHRH